MKGPLKKPLLVVGSVAFDSIRTPRGYVQRILGGSAVHFSLAARFFSRVKIIGVVGTDFPRSFCDRLDRAGINLEGLLTQKGKTFAWKGHYREDYNQAHTLRTELNVFSSFKPVLSAADRHTPHLFLANMDPKLQLWVLNQMIQPHWTACDTMDFWIQQSKKNLIRVLRRVDISLMNDGEAKALSETPHLLQAAQWVQRQGPRLVVIKKGEHGVLCLWKHHVILFPAYCLEDIVDPTGAGDTFAGAFLGTLSRIGKISIENLKHALAYGTILASFNVQAFGAERVLRLSPLEIRGRYKIFQQMVSLK